MTEIPSEFDTSIILEFIAESLEHLEGIDQQLMEYEKNPENTELINSIFRAIHSIKGASGFLQFDDINQLSHRMETLLDQLRKKERDLSQETMDLLLQCCDMLKLLVEEINKQLDNKIDLAVARDNRKLSAIQERLSRLLDNDVREQESSPKDNPTPPESAPMRPASTGYTVTQKLFQEFQVEAGEHLESCEHGLIRLSKKPDDIEAINAVFRDMHSVKGTSSYLGLTDICKLAHTAESMLEVIRRREAVLVSDDELDLLFEALDLLKEMVAEPGTSSEKAHVFAEEIEKKKNNLEKDGGSSSKKATAQPTIDPISIFLDAAEQHISALKECVAGNKDGKDQDGKVDIMFRAVHSLKSSARYMGFEQVETLSATLEATLDSVRNKELELGPAIFDLVADTVKDIEKALADIKSNGKNETPSPLVPNCNTPGPTSETQAPTPTAEQQAVSPKTMRVNQALLDTFMNLVGELIVTRNAFSHIERKLERGDQEKDKAIKELRSASLSVARISEEMQRTVMEMRMVPIRNVFQKFPRMVRDITRKNGKQVQIILQGEDTEIDKGIAEDLADPLVHIIRNAVDHGVETPDERKRAGKAEKGTIILRAAHEGNFIIVEILDDGRGINTDAVLAKAIEKGLTDLEHADSLTHEEICSFIFHPGFSTAQKITDISGRGVGMDVVMTNLKKLKGNVQVTSERGQGTRVRLEVPLTLALVDTLLLQVADQTFAMPLEAVAETVKVQHSGLKSLMNKKAITLRGEVVPVAELAGLIGITHEQKNTESELTLIILKQGGSRLGVIVDRIQRKEEILVKPLADYLAAIPGLAGASILGDGRSILILEPAELIAMAFGK
ncbi:MAG: Hpt domain-containing protein [Deltaproteobacteria bacterium]|nr:Hpt domain-containing protein [Deltaproteobacteria bacterium]